MTDFKNRFLRPKKVPDALKINHLKPNGRKVLILSRQRGHGPCPRRRSAGKGFSPATRRGRGTKRRCAPFHQPPLPRFFIPSSTSSSSSARRPSSGSFYMNSGRTSRGKPIACASCSIVSTQVRWNASSPGSSPTLPSAPIFFLRRSFRISSTKGNSTRDSPSSSPTSTSTPCGFAALFTVSLSRWKRARFTCRCSGCPAITSPSAASRSTPPSVNAKIAIRSAARPGSTPDRLRFFCISGGALGVSPAAGVLDGLARLRHPAQAIVICGKNAEMKAEMEQRARAIEAGPSGALLPRPRLYRRNASLDENVGSFHRQAGRPDHRGMPRLGAAHGHRRAHSRPGGAQQRPSFGKRRASAQNATNSPRWPTRSMDSWGQPELLQERCGRRPLPIPVHARRKPSPIRLLNQPVEEAAQFGKPAAT